MSDEVRGRVSSNGVDLGTRTRLRLLTALTSFLFTVFLAAFEGLGVKNRRETAVTVVVAPREEADTELSEALAVETEDGLAETASCSRWPNIPPNFIK